MTPEQADRMMLGWSIAHLAELSQVELASVYILERLGSAGTDDDFRIQKVLAEGIAERTNGLAAPHY